MSAQDLALQRSKYKHLSDDEWRWFLQQVEGRERTADKLPAFAAIEDWWYPVRLSCEQCSSELAAKYKRELIVESLEYRETGRLKVASRFADLTGGYGVDTYFLSEVFNHTDYVEQNTELCRIATHNFANKPIAIHNTSAEEYLASAEQYDLIFLDPARRDSHGGKVFRLEDCTPNAVELLPILLTHGKRLMIKLSPMLDLTQAVTSLAQVNWDIHIVAIKNEVKELLLLSGGSGKITAIDLEKKDQAFVFTKEEESNSEAVLQCNGLTAKRSYSPKDGQEKQTLFLYEPNAAILKAGAYKLVAQRYGLNKLDVNTHLYASDKLVENFPGRVWRIEDEGMNSERMKGEQANVLTRNYPLTPDQLKKKLHLRDGGTAYIIGCRVAGKPILLYGHRLS